MKGWKIVIRKDEHLQPGDKVMYFEIDSYLPIEPRYEFLRSYSYKELEFKDGNPEGYREEGFRLKTKKLKGIYSQGLVMPLSSFDAEIERYVDAGNPVFSKWKCLACSNNFKVEKLPSFCPHCGAGESVLFHQGFELIPGTDFTNILDINLFVKPIPREMKGKTKGAFPFSIPETDQERVQNLLPYFEEYKDVPFEETEKVDGTSLSAYWKDGDFGVCNRQWDLIEDGTNVLWRAARELGLEEKMKQLGRNIAIQGELAGEGIEKNPLRLVGKRLFVFDIWDIDRRRFLTAPERFGVLKSIGVADHVPVINESIKIFSEYTADRIDDLVARSRGVSMVSKDRQREGLVFKSTVPVNGHVVSFKVLDNKQIVKAEEE